ncbi:MAG: CHAD domain-containing protein [Pirellulaceae bacterium]|nr:CHAD domain-containing protein [Pirellulaceae bacterium]
MAAPEMQQSIIDDTETLVADAALTIDRQLQAVAQSLDEIVSHTAATVRQIHRLRISTRRATATLNLYQDWLPAKERLWMRSSLRRIRRAAGEARDMDVLLKRYARKNRRRQRKVFAADCKRERRRAVRRLSRVGKQIVRTGKYTRRQNKLVSAFRTSLITALQIRTGRRENWQETVQNFLRRSHEPTDSLKSLHRLRVKAKGVRYVLELVDIADIQPQRKDALEVLGEIQKQLGTVNDHEVARRFFKLCRKRTSDAKDRKTLKGLIQRERRKRDDAIADFRKWWCPAALESFRAVLVEMIDWDEMPGAVVVDREVLRVVT